MDLTVRAATADDVDALRDIYRRSSLSNDGDRDALLAAPDALVWEGAALASGGTRVAVDGSGRVLGFVSALPVAGGLELDDLFVDPDAMRRGVASRLLATLAEESGSGSPWIEVTANPHAADFYAAAGFVPVGHTQTRFGPAPRLRLTLTPQEVR